MKTVHHRTCVFKTDYHIVFCTKCRKKVALPDVDDTLKQIIHYIPVEKGFEVSVIETGLDHVHLFASIAPHVSVSDMVK